MKKILIFKLCTPITFESKRNATGSFKEVENFVKELAHQGYSYTVVTSKKYMKEFENAIDLHNYKLEDLLGFDAAVCFNNPLNTYGGAININTLSSYFILNFLSKKTSIPTFYAGADTQLKIGSLVDWINYKNEKKEQNFAPYQYCGDKEIPDFFKTIPSIELDIDGKNLNLITPVFQEDNGLDWKGKENEYKANYFFPFYITHLHEAKSIDTKILPKEELLYDLVYYGNARGGKRTKKMLKFYNEISALKIKLIGKLKPLRDKFTHRKDEDFLGQMNMADLYAETKKSLAHCYISDPQNENRMWTPRIFEAILNRTIVFVDIDNDPQKLMFPDFFYVDNFKQLEDKVNLIKNNIDMREKLLQKQLEAVLTIFVKRPNFFEPLFG